MNLRPVLIVDDDIDHAVIARMVVASVAPGLPVETCMDVRALPGRILDAPTGAVVFIDRMLEGAESIPVVSRAATARPDLYVVLLSASLTDADRHRALESGAREVAEKPGNLEGWRALVSGVLRRASGAHGLAEAPGRVGSGSHSARRP